MVRALPCHGRGCGFESRRSRHPLNMDDIPPRCEDVDPEFAELARQVANGEHPVVKTLVIGESAIRQVFGEATAEQMKAQGRKFVILRKPVKAAPKVGRNDPCPCGSGKKFKKCCE